MGSCFAREVENLLMMRGLRLLLNGHGVPAEHFETWNEETGRGGGANRGELSRGALNKYSVRSMTHELKRSDKEPGLITMCCGGGLGTGTLIERV